MSEQKTVFESATPRTDAQEIAGYDDRVVYADFARKLERELDEVRRTIEQLKKNTPDCPACAEVFWCGSISTEHTCGIPKTTVTLQALNQLKEGE